MKIELLYFEGCPHAGSALGVLKQILEEEGVSADIDKIIVETAEQALKQKFLGSPSLRVNGLDVEPGSVKNSEYGLKCRVYQLGKRQHYSPPKEWIQQAIRQAKK